MIQLYDDPPKSGAVT